ncbi:MAG: hypothetical protein Q7U38_18675 [Methylobacter sp.]|nr:hypothetical protein [Methylobacter sp.]MDP2097463.1 hypothetical protein [Methylobacter sp.]MDP2427237.1 hypothetical protein [Methylobacter sp.]MDP3053979.1 hypothetical protein [Methylobacter sp.]MDP3361579.1 hypothetical protein [Methylobacter sp.]
MTYICSLERIGIEKGIQLGIQIGIQLVTQQRMELAILEGERKMLRKLVESGFGTLPTWVLDKISSAPEHDIDRWAYALLSESSLEAIFNENQV